MRRHRAGTIKRPGLVRELARALEREELEVVYQPIVDRHGVQTRGAEALLRWTKESGEVVPPGLV